MSGVPLWPMAQCLDGRHPPFNLEHYPTGCPFHHIARSTSEGLDVELAEARRTIEAMSDDAADLHDLIGEAATMRTVLGHLLSPTGRIHDSGCVICDEGRALLTAEHELPSYAALRSEDEGLAERNRARNIAWEDASGGYREIPGCGCDECRKYAAFRSDAAQQPAEVCLDCGKGPEAPGVVAICAEWHTRRRGALRSED